MPNKILGGLKFGDIRKCLASKEAIEPSHPASIPIVTHVVKDDEPTALSFVFAIQTHAAEPSEQVHPASTLIVSDDRM